MTQETATSILFEDLGLSQPILESLQKLNYEHPSPIQAEAIPHLLENKDLLGMAQTGTGKTAAFALPAIEKIDVKNRKPQVLVLAPTRELAIQVAESFLQYSENIPGLSILPVYGGQNYNIQLRELKRGVHIVVGTPGRVMDHIENEKLDLSNITTMILDEADEMLRMGFIDDVEWVLERLPEERQTVLFSATMPKPIHKIATKYLDNPVEVKIKKKKENNAKIRQHYCVVKGTQKMGALIRILQHEETNGVIIFTKTKSTTVDLFEVLSEAGFSAAALNGDISQAQRERTVEYLKKGQFDILIATDVAARGLDVDRISHVINYDIPENAETYTHRIGRTGRAGREGDAILFIKPSENRQLARMKDGGKNKIEKINIPSIDDINKKKMTRFHMSINKILEENDFAKYFKIVEEYQQNYQIPDLEIAAVLTKMLDEQKNLFLSDENDLFAQSEKSRRERGDRDRGDREGRGRRDRKDRDRGDRRERGDKRDRRDRDRDRRDRDDSRSTRKPRIETSREKFTAPPEEGMERYRIEIGHTDSVKPGNIVGAIANEIDIDSQYIGRINIFDEHTTVDLPEGMPKQLFKHLKKVRVAGKPMKISKA